MARRLSWLLIDYHRSERLSNLIATVPTVGEMAGTSTRAFVGEGFATSGSNGFPNAA